MRWPAAVVVAAATLAACSSPRASGPVVRGTVEARELVVRSETGGRVLSSSFEEGDTVEKGRILATLDRQELDARLAAAQANRDAVEARLEVLREGSRPQETEQARSEVASARAALARAEEERERGRALRAVGSISAEDLRRLETSAHTARAALVGAEQRLSLLREGPRAGELRALEASLREASAQINLMEVQVERTVIKAPIAGTVARKTVEVGEVVTPGSPVCALTDLENLTLRVFLTERQLVGVRVDQPVEITLETIPGKTFQGRVRSVASSAEFLPRDVESPEDRAFQVFAVKVAVIEPSAEIKPGMGARVLFPSAEPQA